MWAIKKKSWVCWDMRMGPDLYWMVREHHLDGVLKTGQEWSGEEWKRVGERKVFWVGGNSLCKDPEAGKKYLFEVRKASVWLKPSESNWVWREGDRSVSSVATEGRWGLAASWFSLKVCSLRVGYSFMWPINAPQKGNEVGSQYSGNSQD